MSYQNHLLIHTNFDSLEDPRPRRNPSPIRSRRQVSRAKGRLALQQSLFDLQAAGFFLGTLKCFTIHKGGIYECFLML